MHFRAYLFECSHPCKTIEHNSLLENAPIESQACLSIFFHPDFNRWLRSSTESAQYSFTYQCHWWAPSQKKSYWGRGLCVTHYRQWGISPRPEDCIHLFCRYYSALKRFVKQVGTKPKNEHAVEFFQSCIIDPGIHDNVSMTTHP